MVKLTAKQEAFVNHYIETLNATEAARRAGYAANSDVAFRVIGCENLTKLNVKTAIDKRMKDYAMSANEVLFHLSEIARGDMNDFLDSFGTPDIDKARDVNKTRLIKKIKTKTITGENNDIHEIEMELYDRQRALDALAKFHNLTNTTRIDDWRTDAIEAIKKQEVDYPAMEELFGTSLAQELFRMAGIEPLLIGSGETQD